VLLLFGVLPQETPVRRRGRGKKQLAAEAAAAAAAEAAEAVTASSRVAVEEPLREFV